MDAGTPRRRGRHAGGPSRQALGGGGKSPGVSHNPFLCKEQQRWLMSGWGRRQGPGEGAAGRGLGAHSNMQSPAAPGTKLLLKSDTCRNTQTRPRAHMRRGSAFLRVGVEACRPPRSSKPGISDVSARMVLCSTPGPGGADSSSKEGRVVSEVLSARHPGCSEPLHVLAMTLRVGSCVFWHQTCPCLARVRAFPSRAPGTKGCRHKRGEGGPRRRPLPRPTGSWAPGGGRGLPYLSASMAGWALGSEVACWGARGGQSEAGEGGAGVHRGGCGWWCCGPPGGEAAVGQLGVEKLPVAAWGKCGGGDVAVAAIGLPLPPL